MFLCVYNVTQKLVVIQNLYSLNVQEWKSTLVGVILGSLCFGVEIHAQNSGIHSQKSDSNHYFGVDSTILSVDFHSKRKWSLMTPKRVDFHSTALREDIFL